MPNQKVNPVASDGGNFVMLERWVDTGQITSVYDNESMTTK